MTTYLFAILAFVAVIIIFIDSITRDPENGILNGVYKVLAISFFISLLLSLWASLAIAIVLGILIFSPVVEKSKIIFGLFKLVNRTNKEMVESTLIGCKIKFKIDGSSFTFESKGKKADMDFTIFAEEERIIIVCFPKIDTSFKPTLQTLTALNDINQKQIHNTWSIDDDQICVSNSLIVQNSVVTRLQIFMLIKHIVWQVEDEYDLLRSTYSSATHTEEA